jgi:hypothetical protein
VCGPDQRNEGALERRFVGYVGDVRCHWMLPERAATRVTLETGCRIRAVTASVQGPYGTKGPGT